jgi:hypothetical protein
MSIYSLSNKIQKVYKKTGLNPIIIRNILLSYGYKDFKNHAYPTKNYHAEKIWSLDKNKENVNTYVCTWKTDKILTIDNPRWIRILEGNYREFIYINNQCVEENYLCPGDVKYYPDTSMLSVEKYNYIKCTSRTGIGYTLDVYEG